MVMLIHAAEACHSREVPALDRIGGGNPDPESSTREPFGKLRAGTFDKLRAGTFGKLRAGTGFLEHFMSGTISSPTAL